MHGAHRLLGSGHWIWTASPNFGLHGRGFGKTDQSAPSLMGAKSLSPDAAVSSGHGKKMPWCTQRNLVRVWPLSLQAQSDIETLTAVVQPKSNVDLARFFSN